MKKVMKFCVCIIMAFLIGIISGCYTTSSIISDDQDKVPSIDIKGMNPSPKSVKNSDKLIPLSTDASKDDLEFSKVITERGFKKVFILKDNKYGNEYIVVSNGEGVGICLRQQH